MGDLRWPHLPEVLSARFEAARALGALIDAVEKIAEIIPVQPGTEAYKEMLQHHVRHLSIYVAEARRQAENCPPTIGMPSIPEVWTAAFDKSGRMWLRFRDGDMRGDWSPNSPLRSADAFERLSDAELIYEFGPVEMAVDPRG